MPIHLVRGQGMSRSVAHPGVRCVVLASLAYFQVPHRRARLSPDLDELTDISCLLVNAGFCGHVPMITGQRNTVRSCRSLLSEVSS